MTELEMVLRHLQKPEYLHVLLNPIPVHCLAAGVSALLLATLMGSKRAQVVALLLVLVSSAAAAPVFYFGQQAYMRVFMSLQSTPEAQQWLDVHMARAERWIYIFYANALLAIASLVLPRKFPRAAIVLIFVTIVTSFCAIAIGGWIGHAGGQVRHFEFREGPPPRAAAPHEHSR